MRAWPGDMTARGAGAAAFALVVLTAVPGVAGSATPTPVPPTSASLPPELQALEAKMRQLQVDSERYSVQIKGSFTSTAVTVSGSGTCTSSASCKSTSHRRVVRMRHSLNALLTGEVSLSAHAGELHSDGGRPDLIAIGSSLYRYSPGRTRRSRARPWVHEGVSFQTEALLGLLIPYRGGLPGERSLGGSGPYAGLLNLMATASGAVVSNGSATVDGQSTVKFSTAVRPMRLAQGLSASGLASLERRAPPQRIEVFLTESGLPLRVVLTTGRGSDPLTVTTDVLAVNAPVNVRRPPARRTRSGNNHDASTHATLKVL